MTTRKIIGEDFLLQNKYARQLYFDYAAPQPIIDYHNHLPPKEIFQDRVYENPTQVWISGDHYKWRAMRTLGIEEKYITGEASDREKFRAWAKAVPQTLRNPLFHWTHLELTRYFGIEGMLSEENADQVYDQISTQLQEPGNSCRGLLEQMNVKALCTTEDPTDNLQWHQKLHKEGSELIVNTAFRPDKAYTIGAPGYADYLETLGKTTDIEISSYQDLLSALSKSMEYFHQNACRLSDHGLGAFPFREASEAELEKIFEKARSGGKVTPQEAEKFTTAILLFLGEAYHEKGWVQQYHIGALRNNNTRMLEQLGPDTGWDSMGDYQHGQNLSRFLDHLDKRNKLSKTIIYNLNPADNMLFASMIGNFNDGSVRGKVQYGSAWWFLDQKEGIEHQLNALSNVGLISCFIGMLTDSRSFLSFPRHEYFRRVLCNLLGAEMERGELPQDMELVGKLVADISYHNAKEYFEFLS